MSHSAPAINTGAHPAPDIYSCQNKVRFVTAASLFDGHDASINIMRRILQASGAEVIHLGHNRSVLEIVDAAIQEDVQGIAISSYQGGHVEYFKYLRDLLNERGADHIRLFGGGGGVIVPEEIRELHEHGVTRIFSPEDGRKLGLQGMINFMLESCDFNTCPALNGHFTAAAVPEFYKLSRGVTYLENAMASASGDPDSATLASAIQQIAESASAARRLHAKTDNATGAASGHQAPVLGITGPGGAGKSSLTDELCLRFLENNPELRLAIVAVDPTRRKTGGALLGDRIRMNSPTLFSDRVFVRSLATRGANRSVSHALKPVLNLLKASGFDLILLETSGTGQSDDEVTQLADRTLYVMTAEFGAPTQLEKIAMLDFADVVALNKAEKRGSADAVRHVQKQFQRNHTLFDRPVDSMPVHATVASRFNDPGVNALYNALVTALAGQTPQALQAIDLDNDRQNNGDIEIIEASRARYLSEIAETLRGYHGDAAKNIERAHDLDAVRRSMALLRGRDLNTDTRIREATDGDAGPLGDRSEASNAVIAALRGQETEILDAMDARLRKFLHAWPATRDALRADEFQYKIRDQVLTQPLKSETLSGLQLPAVALPPYESLGELARYFYKENLPGNFPFTASVFPFRRAGEDPTRMFAGEGGPERTNTRFHYLAGSGEQANDSAGGDGAGPARLSTAFDSVTLYGEDPHIRPDIYGKVGNSGVSIPSLDDCKRLYSGFDLIAPSTSVSMTINGPAPVVLAFFFNTAVDQQIEAYLKERGELDAARKKVAEFYAAKNLPAPVYRKDRPRGHDGRGVELLGLSGDHFVDREVYEKIKTETLQKVRGTVQADILKEDQAQNTCIFSTAFALRMMGDMQEFFVARQIRNFYSVSISGYHIAEAGANPITQLAFTLANGFTYVEYYLKRGLKIDDFAPNLSFFFSNGLDAEYSVIGRVARRIWSVAMARLYEGSERSQKLKYHIQTSGRSLHAREIDFNDIRTTLQALYALYDNCNSLHTNAYDEAITTPTEDSVRRAVAIQLIINKELGLNKNHNPVQGAYIIDELTDLVEEAVLAEFDRLTERGGVPGAMETMYQRGKIQEESLHYEHLKHSGDLPIVGVNTFLNDAVEEQAETELMRSTDAEKEEQIAGVQAMQTAFADRAPDALQKLKQTALSGGNIFEELMETVKVATLGQVSGALYSVGGSYRRNM
ncbi:MAG: methylmalonyl-CoA mutase family protein [bacterium]|nr:methylmalonyl-CoA mutase family protein [bacterium]